MKKPIRIQLRRTKGWKLPPNTVVVSRPSKWGNPFRVSKYGQDGAVYLYTHYMSLPPEYRPKNLDVTELRGKNLACWCKNSPCHADVLLRLANS
jgi:hypothetical protein